MACHSSDFVQLANTRLSTIDRLVTGQWARPVSWRQPIHTCYVPADQLAADTPTRWASIALETLASAYEMTANEALEVLATDLGIRTTDIPAVAELTAQKLQHQPIEDLRIDFEDGFTQRGVAEPERDEHEDALALVGARFLAQWFRGGATDVPAFAGIRFKSFDPAVRARGLRTLVIVLDELHSQGVLSQLYDPTSKNFNPRALRLTFPKVQHRTQVETLVEILSQLEKDYGLDSTGGKIHLEVQVETPQAVVGPAGESEAARIISAAEGRCLALHYGTYDYSASMGVDAAHQSMEHPVADHAKDMLQVATGAAGVELSDGSTNCIPVGDRESIMDGWQLHYRLVTRHLRRGIRQGWDLHPNQIVTRHMATIAYFRENWEVTAHRLNAYLTGDTSHWMDEPATAKAMAGYLRRAHSCGAITDDELAVAGVSDNKLVNLKNLEKLQLTGHI